MTFFKRWNNIIGWGVFAVAVTVYLMTMEPVSSLWDCSEYIATSYKLEVGHPPGAPLFMILARIATIFAPSVDEVPMMINGMNSIASAFCILFLFWSITHLARKLYTKSGNELSIADAVTVLGAGVVGALAYTFTDSFWFSAIEGEVYALSSMFTALVFWLMLKWEEQADEPQSARWIVLIAYLMGLSIGVHILNLLTIPALVYVYYFRKTDKVTLKGLVVVTLIAGAILMLINAIIIPYTVYFGAMVDLLFVNSFGLPVNSGMALFALLLIGGMGYMTWLAYRKGRVILNTILLCITMILIGFSSYASVTIRAAATPPMNSNNPDNPFALLSFLNRDQYGSKPLLYGASYSASPIGVKEREFHYLDQDGKYKKSSEITGYEFPSEFMGLFPRMWNNNKSERDYKPWAAYRTKMEVARDKNGEVVRDAAGNPQRQNVVDYGEMISYQIEHEGKTYTIDSKKITPTFGENLYFFFSYQLNYMYWRYFLWNFVGRQNDIQASNNTITDGNWISGVEWIDEKYIGPQDNLPSEIANNKARNRYYFLPFLLGLIGLIYQLNRDQRNFSIVMLLFIMTGIALVVYFNSSPGEPRERDYVYAGSFYAFSIWIGFGVLAIRDLIMVATKRNTVAVACVATAVCFSVPTILAAENWDDHDRSNRYMARDIGWNYLQSTLPNSIILNYGDNDTFPLWNNQEVYGVRPDVRIMNTSYLGGAWYIDDMKTKANDAMGVPFSLPKRKYTYKNDVIDVLDLVDRSVDIKEVINFVISDEAVTKNEMNEDFIPTNKIAIPVNKENAIASGIVAEKDRHLMVDTVFINITKERLDKSELMILDMLANFDWKRPIYLTQIYLLQSFGLLDYLQYDGYAYRLVPIFTPIDKFDEIGRVDADYITPLIKDVYRYGNLKDESVYVDHFHQYNLSAANTRGSFARAAKALLSERRVDEAVEILDKALVELPTSQILFTSGNTYPLINSYYVAAILSEQKAYESGDSLAIENIEKLAVSDANIIFQKGDNLSMEYINNLIEYVEYYLQFEGVQEDMISNVLDSKLDELSQIYSLVGRNQRIEVIKYLNEYYRTLGVSDDSLIDVSGYGDAATTVDTTKNGDN